MKLYVYILKDPKNSSISSPQDGRSICFSYSNRSLGFGEVLRKQEVYGGTFPIPLKTNLMGYWLERTTFCPCLIWVRTIPQLRTIHAEHLYGCK